MEQHPENPTANALPPGMAPGTLTEAVAKSGYPLQTVVGRSLIDEFSVIEEWGYIDRDSGDARSLDIHAYKSLLVEEASVFHPDLVLLIECKRSDLPYVFFTSVLQELPRDFPQIVGFRRSFGVNRLDQTRSASASEFLCLQEFSFLHNGPTVCNAFARAEGNPKKLTLSGSVPFQQVIMPLASAFQHWKAMREVKGDQPRYFPSLTLNVCVLDAPMVLADGGSEEPELTLTPWIRLVRQESFSEHVWLSYRHYVVDFVHVGYLNQYIASHVLPFATDVAKRIVENEEVVMSGKVTVTEWDGWSWADVVGP